MRAEQEREYVEFVRARAITLRRVAYRLCGDWHGAQDLVQRAFVLLYRRWRQAGHLLGWRSPTSILLQTSLDDDWPRGTAGLVELSIVDGSRTVLSLATESGDDGAPSPAHNPAALTGPWS